MIMATTAVDRQNTYNKKMDKLDMVKVCIWTHKTKRDKLLKYNRKLNGK